MNNFFLDLYAGLFGIEDSRFQLIFDHAFYYNGGYTDLGLAFLLIPFVFVLLFYFAYKYPYSKWWHWAVVLLVCVVVVFSWTYQLTINLIYFTQYQELRTALSDPNSGYSNFADDLILKLSFINTALSILMFSIYSLIAKQFSKAQGHLPI